jgi:hypothetical protein
MATNTIDIVGIPDFDQRRDVLPNNGAMYCGPTATYNNVFFMGTHGFPQLLTMPWDPGNVILTNSKHTGVGIRIAEMGAWDGTDPVKGGGQAGTFGFLQSRVPDKFCVLTYFVSGSGLVSPDAMADWMSLGCLVTMWIGWYTNPWSSTKGRDGGHALTMTGLTTDVIKVAGNGVSLPGTEIEFTVRYRDPASDEAKSKPKTDPDLAAQSPAVMAQTPLFPEVANFAGKACQLYGLGPKPAMSGANVFSARYPYIDGYQVIWPLMALTGVTKTVTQSAVAGAAPKKMMLVKSASFHPERGYGDRESIDLSELVPTSLVDAAFDRIRPLVVIAGRDSLELSEINVARATRRALATLPLAPRRIVAGGSDGAFFVLMPGYLGKVRADGLVASVATDPTIEALAYDDDNHQLIAVSATQLLTFDDELTLVARAPFVAEGRGRLTVHVDPLQRRLLVLRAGDTSIRAVGLGVDAHESTDIVLRGARMPAAFAVGPGGALYVSDGGRLREHDRDGSPRPDSALDGAEAGDILVLPRGIDNSLEAGVVGPAWRTLAAEDVNRLMTAQPDSREVKVPPPVAPGS